MPMPGLVQINSATHRFVLTAQSLLGAADLAECQINMCMLHVLNNSQTAWNNENRCDFPKSFRRKELQHFVQTDATKV